MNRRVKNQGSEELFIIFNLSARLQQSYTVLASSSQLQAN